MWPPKACIGAAGCYGQVQHLVSYALTKECFFGDGPWLLFFSDNILHVSDPKKNRCWSGVRKENIQVVPSTYGKPENIGGCATRFKKE